MTAPPVVLVPLAEGFEEIEAVTIIDVLRRAGIEVLVAGLAPGLVRGSHGIAVETDGPLADVAVERLTMLVLPGGQPGTDRLRADPRILSLVRELAASGRTVAAICAAPMVLADAGVLQGRDVTSHPSVRGLLGPARVVEAPRVVRSGRVLTSQGPGTALEFSLDIVRELCGAEQAEQLGAAMLVAAPPPGPSV